VSTPWRNDARLAGRFHESYPDDLQVLVHQGGPRLSDRAPELIWVRLIGTSTSRGVYRGSLLNQPHQLTQVRQGSEILVLVAEGAPHPVRTTMEYLRERSNYEIRPCHKCGFAELFDAPSALIAKVFPNTPSNAVVEQFTSFCPLCGGVQGVVLKAQPMESTHQPEASTPSSSRRWWQFWKA
jgi:hypothetical protein